MRQIQYFNVNIMIQYLIDYPISSTAPETKRIVAQLTYLTKHKDRKIYNPAKALLQHWSQNITDQTTQR